MFEVNPLKKIDEEKQAGKDRLAKFEGLKKKAIYKELSEKYLLPEFSCRAISKTYLAGVDEGIYYRVQRSSILEFESKLPWLEKHRAIQIPVSAIVERLSRFLSKIGKSELGFKPGCFADERWLLRVIRFEDRYNILGFFRTRAPGAQKPNNELGRM